MVGRQIFTYIIITVSGEYYCGKSIDVHKRIYQHSNEKKPHWFAYKDRKKFCLIKIIKGNYENNIKRFGVKKYIESINNEEVEEI